MRYRSSFGITAFFLLFVILLTETASPASTDTLIARLRAYDPDVRLARVEAIKGTTDRQLVTALSFVADNLNEDWHIRISAIRLLGATGDPGATDALMTALRDFCPAIRWNAARALAGFRDDPRVIDALIDSLRSETLFVAEAAADSLGAIGSSRAVPGLIDGLGSPSFAIRASAVRSLGEIGDPKAAPYLEKIAGKDADPLIRSEALSALRKIGEREKGSGN